MDCAYFADHNALLHQTWVAWGKITSGSGTNKTQRSQRVLQKEKKLKGEGEMARLTMQP